MRSRGLRAHPRGECGEGGSQPGQQDKAKSLVDLWVSLPDLWMSLPELKPCEQTENNFSRAREKSLGAGIYRYPHRRFYLTYCHRCRVVKAIHFSSDLA